MTCRVCKHWHTAGFMRVASEEGECWLGLTKVTTPHAYQCGACVVDPNDARDYLDQREYWWKCYEDERTRRRAAEETLKRLRERARKAKEKASKTRVQASPTRSSS